MNIDKQLVYRIVRDHFQKDDAKQRKFDYTEYWNSYFYECCSCDDIISLTYESTCIGLFELFKHTSRYLLHKYGLFVFRRNTWSTIGRKYKNRKYADALLLADESVISDHYIPNYGL